MKKKFPNYLRLGLLLCEFSILKKDTKFKKNSEHWKQLMCRSSSHTNDICIPSFDVADLEKLADPLGKKMSLINLRPNPCIFIDGSCYELRNVYSHIDTNFLLSSNLHKNIEEQEIRLKLEVEQEATLNSGDLMTHSHEDHSLKTVFIRPTVIETPRELFEKIKGLRYYRLPLPKNTSILKNDIFSFLQKNYEAFSDTSAIFYSASGGTRTTFASCLYKILGFKKKNLFSKFQEGNLSEEPQKIEALLREVFPEFEHKKKVSCSEKAKLFYENSESFKSAVFADKEHVVFSLKLIFSGQLNVINAIQCFIDHKCSKQIVDFLIDDLEPFENIKDALAVLLVRDTGTYDEKIIIKANMLLEWYMTLILFTEYLFQNTNTEFTDWISKNKMYRGKFLYLADRRAERSVFKPATFKNKFEHIYKLNYHNKDNYSVLYRKRKNVEKVELCFDQERHPITIIEGQVGMKNCIVINLLEEPLIYIKGEAYFERNLISYKKSIKIFENIHFEKLEEIEKMIKVKLGKKCATGGHLEYYTVENGEIVKNVLRNVCVNDIQTPCEYFASITGSDAVYFRFPLTPNFHFKLSNFTLFTKLLKNLNFADKTVFTISDNTKRAIFCCIWLDLAKKQHEKVEEEKAVVKIYSIRELIRVLDFGRSSLSLVDRLFKKYSGSDFYTHLKTINNKKTLIVAVKRYFYTICFSAYLLSSSSLSFDTWMLSRREICNMFNLIDEDVSKEDFFIEIGENKNRELSYLANRKGRVASNMIILKNDYFSGFSLFDSVMKIEGIFNMRIIKCFDNLIIGCGMPKANLIERLINKVRKKHGKENAKIHWFCAREEPVVYLNNSPYVLRKHSNPDENIEIKGIGCDIVQKMEVQLKKDIYDEMRDNSVLVHDSKLENGEWVLSHDWIDVKKVKTTAEAFNIRTLVFHRIPVTDECAPIPQLICYIYKALRKIRGHKILFFNCQSGRGRTTTFMILSYMTLMKDKLETVPWESIEYKRPRFFLIKQLLKFLPNALRSKKFADYVIDQFDHIQNLRDVIEEKAKSDKKELRKTAQAFLLRYLYLICFAEFIVGKEKCFLDFLLNHPEIQDLVNSRLNMNLDLI